MIGTLYSVVLDGADITALSSFYGALLDRPVHTGRPDWHVLDTGAPWRLSFQLAPDHTAPAWPGQDRPQQGHLDVRVPDLAAEVARAQHLGATVLGGTPGRFTVLADPAGHPLCLVHGDVDRPQVADVVFDCADGQALAVFYAGLLGLEVTYTGPEGAMTGGGDGLPVMFQSVAGYRAPHWPDPAHPQQLHLDVEVADLDAGERQVLASGAARLPGGGADFRVFADPAGHPFCLVC